MSIEEFVGKKMTNEDINEPPDLACDRIGNALEEIRQAISSPGDHAIAVGHFDTLEALAARYGVRKISYQLFS